MGGLRANATSSQRSGLDANVSFHKSCVLLRGKLAITDVVSGAYHLAMSYALSSVHKGDSVTIVADLQAVSCIIQERRVQFALVFDVGTQTTREVERARR